MSKNSVSRPLVAVVRISALASAVALGGCAHQEDTGPAAPQAPGTPAPLASVIVEPPPAPASAAAATAAPVGPQAPQIDPPIILKDVGFKTPESVLYDPEQDAYFVSNINGTPFDVDGNGFISKVTPDGKSVELMWIDGSKKTSALNAPKGLAVSGNVLYVADITFVRMFDRKTGAPKGKIAIPGATFLNDLTTGPDGTVYVSDSGLKPGKNGFEPSGTDSVYKIVKGNRPVKLIADKELGGPNGLVADDSGVWVVTFGSGELFRVDPNGKKEAGQKLPQGTLDGVVKLSDGSLLVSSWAASAIFRGTPGGAFEAIVRDVKSPADIGYDTKRNVILIPLFQLDAVELEKLPGPPPASASSVATPAATAPLTTPPSTPATTLPATGTKGVTKGPITAPAATPVGGSATPATPVTAAPK
ncbi:MAG TPA: hypothetical protein VHC69_04705 [Polyangiaceae bacterium]|nr:hypothetical protein [Polyangiaceae bacterium]